MHREHKMTSRAISKLVVFAAVIVYLFSGMNIPFEPQGDVSDDFKEVKRLFTEMLRDEAEGVAMSVLYKGELVVDMYAGYSDKTAAANWKKNTLGVFYSSTKIFGGLCFAVLESRGYVNYDKEVSFYWPEFGKHNKENLTVRELLDHRSGLVKFSREFTPKEASQPNVISNIIEESAPMWPAGTHLGYHALTYGFLLDELFRRVDPKQRNISQFVEQEVKNSMGDKDFYIGLPKEEHHRVARVVNPPLTQSFMAHIAHPLRFLNIIHTHAKYGGLADISANFPYFLSVMRRDNVPYNNPEIQQLPIISSMGIGTPRAFAKTVRQFWEAGIIPEEKWEKLIKPNGTAFDICLAHEKKYGHGFFYHPVPNKEEEWAIVFVGNGQQFIEVDKERDLVIALVRNGLKPGDWGSQSYEKIRNFIYETLDRKKQY